MAAWWFQRLQAQNPKLHVFILLNQAKRHTFTARGCVELLQFVFVSFSWPEVSSKLAKMDLYEIPNEFANL